MGASEGHRHVAPVGAEPRQVRWPSDLDLVRRLFRDYREWIAVHQDSAAGSEERVRLGLALIDRLIEELPGAYGPPRGDILLWFEGEQLVACGALRELEPGVGEIRRVYVRADYRGGSFGPPFVRALIERARELGYSKLKVDTLSTMRGAIDFYHELGFRPAREFWPHPVAGALFFEREISG